MCSKEFCSRSNIKSYCRKCRIKRNYENKGVVYIKKKEYYQTHRKQILAKKIRSGNPRGRSSKVQNRGKEIIDYYLQGNSQRKTGEKFGFTQSGIAYILNKYKVNARKRFMGEKNPKWRGGICIDKDGRKLIYSPNHPKPDVDKIYCYEYRLIIEKDLGRYLEKGEIIHHINSDVTDNRIENLEVMSQSEHITLHKKQGDMQRREV